MTEKEFCEILELICEEPRLHTPNGSFFETVAYLEGYSKHALIGIENHCALTPFRQWLTEKYSLAEACINWKFFRGRFENDNEAINKLAIFYREYVESK